MMSMSIFSLVVMFFVLLMIGFMLGYSSHECHCDKKKREAVKLKGDREGYLRGLEKSMDIKTIHLPTSHKNFKNEISRYGEGKGDAFWT